MSNYHVLEINKTEASSNLRSLMLEHTACIGSYESLEGLER